MPSRPTGIVTFLFTDIEGSTTLWDARPADMSRALARHDAIVRGAIASRDGIVFSTGGDGVGAAFGRASAAAEAAIEVQRALRGEPWPDGMAIRVRMGLHTGEAEERDDDYFGAVVNEAARVMALAHGDQILLTATTAGLLGPFEVLDLGDHGLKGVSGTRRLFQLAAGGLPRAFPPLRAAHPDPGNLPAGSGRLIGRDDAVERVVALLRTSRLVTLTGVGGIGKTRLATHVADLLRREHAGGVWVVDLAPVTDAAGVVSAVVSTLRVPAPPGVAVADALAAGLAGRRVLLLLDNCEHVVRPVADLVRMLVERVDSVTVLATSREGLGVAAEHLWPVPPLDATGGTAAPAVELFSERARQLVPGFALADRRDLDAVIEICHRLDGVPLAIELAAARMVSMSPAEVRDRLDQRFRLLAGGRGALERHQTLRHAVGWSFELLTDVERTVLQGTSVFAGGLDLAAAVDVCGDGRDEFELLDVLAQLVRKSLLLVDRREGRTRYGHLETIRQFAEEQLAVSGRADERRRLHAEHLVARLEQAIAEFDSPALPTHLGWLDSELDNIGAAYHWATATGDLATAAALACGAMPLALCIQRFEPSAWAERLLPAATAAEIPALPDLYVTAAYCSMTGRPDDAIRYGQHALELEQDARFVHAMSRGAWNLLAVAFAFTLAYDRAIALAEAAAARPEHRTQGLASLLMYTAFGGYPERARAIGDDVLAAVSTTGGPYWLAHATWSYGRAFADSDPRRALAVYEEGLTHSRANRLRFFEMGFLREAAALEFRHGDQARALGRLDEVIGATYTSGDMLDFTITTSHLVRALAASGQPAAAAVLAGWTENKPGGYVAADHETVVDALRAELGADYDGRAAAGRALSVDEVYAFARDQIDAELVRRSPG